MRCSSDHRSPNSRKNSHRSGSGWAYGLHANSDDGNHCFGESSKVYGAIWRSLWHFERCRAPPWWGLCGSCNMAMVSSMAAPSNLRVGLPVFRFRCFWINLPFGGIAFLAVLVFVRKGRPAAVAHGDARKWYQRLASIDWVATVLVLAVVTCLVLGTTWGGSDKGWKDGGVIASLVVCGALVPAIILWEIHMGEKAMLIMSLFRNWSFDAILGRSVDLSRCNRRLALTSASRTAKYPSAGSCSSLPTTPRSTSKLLSAIALPKLVSTSSASFSPWLS